MDVTGDKALPAISVRGLSKTYPDGTVAVHELWFDVAQGEVAVLVGPSGCGKTTTMKMLNRLVEPTAGTALVGGLDIASADPVQLRRSIGYVIQSVGLFPHRTIRQNVATVPVLLGWNRRRRNERTDELLELVDLNPAIYGDRYPHQLSGGQRQRVGVARALAADPPVLLMDEPFGAVDPVVRERLQTEFSLLQRRLGTTVVFVTHDMAEAVRLGDRIAVMRKGGFLEQYDTPAAILGDPATESVAEFVGSDRAITRLSVTPLDVSALEQPPILSADVTPEVARATLGAAGWRWGIILDADRRPVGWVSVSDDRGDHGGLVGGYSRTVSAVVELRANLRQVMALLLAHDDGFVAVVDPSGRYLGVITSAGVHDALRRSVLAHRSHSSSGAVELGSISA